YILLPYTTLFRSLSATYQQSSAVRDEVLESDPFNKLLTRGSRTRLPAEIIRDQALAMSGLLNPNLYAPSVMPYEPASITSFNGTFWHESKGKDRYRRALYTYRTRTNSCPSTVASDRPSREVCNSKRVRPNTPRQALTPLHDPAYVDAADAMAKTIMQHY